MIDELSYLPYVEVQSLFQLIGGALYLLWIVYCMFVEVRLWISMKWAYFRRFWSYIEVGLIVCVWSYVGVIVKRQFEFRRICDRFAQTNGFVYINLQWVC
jgi:hypothetical protein